MGQRIHIADAVNRDASLNRGLVSWWLALPDQQRGNVFRDLMGRNHGTLTNGPTWGGALGRPGGFGAVSFDGSDDYVNCTGPVIAGSKTFTWMCWVKTTTAGNNTMMGEGNTADNSPIVLLEMNRTANKLSLFFRDASSADATATSSTSVNDGLWHYVGAVGDGSSLQVYVDGRADGSSVSLGAVASFTSNTMSLGALRRASTAVHWAGTLDSAEVFNIALSASTIRNRYDDSRQGYPLTLNRVRPYSILDTGGAAPATAFPWHYYQQMQAM